MSESVDDIKFKREFGERLQKARQARGWTQPDLAYHSEVSLGSIRNIEQGRRLPNLMTLVRMLRVLGADANDIIFHELEKPSENTEDEYQLSLML